MSDMGSGHCVRAWAVDSALLYNAQINRVGMRLNIGSAKT